MLLFTEHVTDIAQYEFGSKLTNILYGNIVQASVYLHSCLLVFDT